MHSMLFLLYKNGLFSIDKQMQSVSLPTLSKNLYLDDYDNL